MLLVPLPIVCKITINKTLADIAKAAISCGSKLFLVAGARTASNSQ